MTPDEELIALRREVRELREELAEYRACERPLADREIRHRWVRVRHRLAPDVPRLQFAAVLLALLKHPGAPMPKERLLAAMTSDAAEKTLKLVDVAIWDARRVLRPYGIGITTIWGVGYAMSSDDCARLKALLGGILDD